MRPCPTASRHRHSAHGFSLAAANPSDGSDRVARTSDPEAPAPDKRATGGDWLGRSIGDLRLDSIAPAVAHVGDRNTLARVVLAKREQGLDVGDILVVDCG